MKIQLNGHTLCAGASGHELPQNLRLWQGPAVQEIRCIGAPSLQVCERGNLRTRLQFQVKRRHPSPLQAALFLLEHASHTKGLQGPLTLQSSGPPGERSFSMSQAVLQEVSGQMDAVHTLHTYTLVGGALGP